MTKKSSFRFIFLYKVIHYHTKFSILTVIELIIIGRYGFHGIAQTVIGADFNLVFTVTQIFCDFTAMGFVKSLADV